MPTADFIYQPIALQPLETNGPQMEVIGTNAKRVVWSFDDTTQEYVAGSFMVPSDVSTSGSVTFRAMVMAKTAAAGKNIAFEFDHRANADSEALDPASPYTTEASGDAAVDATQDDLTVVSWTETLTNLGWTANEHVQFRLSRKAASANNLVGDVHLLGFSVEIPLG